MEGYSIGTIAKITGISRDRLRNYEKDELEENQSNLHGQHIARNMREYKKIFKSYLCYGYGAF